jgi:acyl-CoA synthetase (AMP-forming)/AMP-acid ligase II
VLTVGITAGATPAELAKICDDCAPRVLFVHESLEATARAADLGADVRIVVIGRDYDEWLASARPVRPEVDPSRTEAAWLQYTSGSTGVPKGAVISQHTRVLQYLVSAAEYGFFTPRDHHLVIGSLAHGIGSGKALTTLFGGGACSLAPMFHPERIVRMIGSRQITTTIIAPAHLRALLELPDATLARADLTSLRGLICGGAPLSQATKEEAIERIGDGILWEDYGSTEVPVIASLHPEDQLRKHQSVGRPYLGNSIVLLDGEGQAVAPGEVGELHVRSPYVFLGYWKRPEETAAAFRGRYYRTGDLARIDDEGYIYLLDRVHDRILSGGYTVSAREVEDVIADHPSIADVAVFGVPDDVSGEAVRAAIVVRPGDELPDGDLLAFCEQRLSLYKRPKWIDRMEQLPRGPTGKVLRTELRDPFWVGRDRSIG